MDERNYQRNNWTSPNPPPRLSEEKPWPKALSQDPDLLQGDGHHFAFNTGEPIVSADFEGDEWPVLAFQGPSSVIPLKYDYLYRIASSLKFQRDGLQNVNGSVNLSLDIPGLGPTNRIATKVTVWSTGADFVESIDITSTIELPDSRSIEAGYTIVAAAAPGNSWPHQVPYVPDIVRVKVVEEPTLVSYSSVNSYQLTGAYNSACDAYAQVL